MSDLRVLPQKVALVFCIAAFGGVWLVGMVSDVAAHTTAVRAVAAAAAFWAMGLVMGRAFVNALSQALSEHLQKYEATRDGAAQE